VVRGGVEPPTFRFSGALSRAETKNASASIACSAALPLVRTVRTIVATVPRCAVEFRFVCGDPVGITGAARTCGDSVGLRRLPQEARPASRPTMECQRSRHPPLLTVTSRSAAHEPFLTHADYECLLIR
jgi:hypothetical protein